MFIPGLQVRNPACRAKKGDVVNKSGFTHESFVNKSCEWYTPQYIFDWLGMEFDLDPCHPKERLPWIPVKNVFTEADNGLEKDWAEYGSVWLNPPYGRLTAPFLNKMSRHRNGVALLFSRTDCRWFHDYIKKADAVLFLKGRIKFVDGNGVTGGGGAACGSILVGWGRKAMEAFERNSDKGYFVLNMGGCNYGVKDD